MTSAKTLTGRLTKDRFGASMPVDAPYYQAPPFYYRDAQSLSVSYETDAIWQAGPWSIGTRHRYGAARRRRARSQPAGFGRGDGSVRLDDVRPARMRPDRPARPDRRRPRHLVGLRRVGRHGSAQPRVHDVTRHRAWLAVLR